MTQLQVVHTYYRIIFDKISETAMKGQFQARPQSKNINKQMRPSSRFVNSDLAQQSFKKAKEFQKHESYDKAIEQYLRALMYDPNYFQAYCNMGSCYRSQGKYLEARSMYLKSIAIKSDDVISHYNLANVQRIIGNYQSSIKQYEYVIKTGQSGSQNIGSLFANSLVNLGICFKLTQQYEKAIDCYERARKLDPNDEVIIFNQAMAIMAILQTIDIQIFSEVSKEKAAKAQTLLKQLLKNNPKHEMANLKLCRVSSILDKSNENLNRIVSKLKEMLANESTIKDEINSELGYALKLLKEYQKSATHYNQSFNKPKSNKVIETNIYDGSSNYVNEKINVFSEQEAIKLIKQGRIDEVKQSIKLLEEANISKHVAQLAIELQLAEKESQDHFKAAVQIYDKYFTQNKSEIPFDKVSIEAHKLIGNVLSKQNKFKQSIKHFEYISSQLKSNVERSAVHTSLGSDYEAMGDKEKALQQYKLALEQEPDNYQLIYNVGCCLHDGGNYAESNIYFQKFLRLIRDDNKILLPTKNLYIADCLVTMAGSIPHGNAEEFQRYENAWKAIRQVEQGEEQSQVQFDPSKLLNFYLRWADLLQDKMLTQSDKKSQPFLQSKEILLDVYMSLLQIPGCPDRDAILNNCAILYYQEKLYVNALANLNQVTIPSALSLNSLSLTYLHLGEHYMATKSIYSAFQQDSKDPLIIFNKELIQWIYGISKEGRLSQLIDNQDDSKIFSRWQFSILLIDSLSKKLKDLKEEQSLDQKVKQILQKAFESNSIELNLDEIGKIKFRYVVNQLTPIRTVTAGFNFEQLVSFCVTKSQNIEKDLKHLLEQLDNKEINSAIRTLLLNTFIFINKQKSHSIRAYLQGHYRTKVTNIKIDMDRRATITEEEHSKQYSFSSISDIVMNLCTWQCELESKIAVLFHIIEKIYYGLRFKDLLEVQYHFPRHNQLEDCSMTVNRIVSLIVKAFQVKTNINLKESTISKMKNQLIDEIQGDFQIQMRKQPLTTLTLNETLKVLTINAYFSSKDQCIKFVRQLQKQSSNKKQLEINKNTQEIDVLISGILGLRCTWNEQSPLKNAIESLLKSPLDLYHQSIFEIDQNLCFAQESNDKAWEKLFSFEVFKS